jgi:hypothetical protein
MMQEFSRGELWFFLIGGVYTILTTTLLSLANVQAIREGQKR